ncbi:MAG TPA: hypothetical protein VNP73_04875, partial [Actinomycetota bacterium]|nr:hypothetical protein [Actinomycetota bacterium]
MKTSRIAALFVAAAVGSSAGAAAAAEIDASSKIGLKYRPAKGAIAGRVSVPTTTEAVEKICTRDRVVKLVKIESGKKRVVKKTATRKLGRYGFQVAKAGRYQAKVLSK